MENVSCRFCLWKSCLSSDCNWRMPISLDETLKRVFCQWLCFLEKWEVFIDCFSKNISNFFHLTIFVGRNINKKIWMDLTSLEILKSAHQQSCYSEYTWNDTWICATVQSNFSCSYFQSSNHVSSQWSSKPQTVIVEASWIEAEKYKRISYSFLQFLKVVRHVLTSTLLISFRNHHTSR